MPTSSVPVAAANNPFPAGTPIDPNGRDCANFVQNAFGLPVGGNLGQRHGVQALLFPILGRVRK